MIFQNKAEHVVDFEFKNILTILYFRTQGIIVC